MVVSSGDHPPARLAWNSAGIQGRQCRRTAAGPRFCSPGAAGTAGSWRRRDALPPSLGSALSHGSWAVNRSGFRAGRDCGSAFGEAHRRRGRFPHWLSKLTQPKRSLRTSVCENLPHQSHGAAPSSTSTLPSRAPQGGAGNWASGAPIGRAQHPDSRPPGGFWWGRMIRFPAGPSPSRRHGCLLDRLGEVRPGAEALAQQGFARSPMGCTITGVGGEADRSATDPNPAGTGGCNVEVGATADLGCSVIHQAWARSTQAIHSHRQGQKGQAGAARNCLRWQPDRSPFCHSRLRLKATGGSASLRPGPLATEAARLSVSKPLASTKKFPPPDPCGKRPGDHSPCRCRVGEASTARPQPAS